MGSARVFHPCENLLIGLREPYVEVDYVHIQALELDARKNIIRDSVTVYLRRSYLYGRIPLSSFQGALQTEYTEKAIVEDGVLQIQPGAKVRLIYIPSCQTADKLPAPITLNLKVKYGKF